jgi:hypothetical protein
MKMGCKSKTRNFSSEVLSASELSHQVVTILQGAGATNRNSPSYVQKCAAPSEARLFDPCHTMSKPDERQRGLHGGKAR